MLRSCRPQEFVPHNGIVFKVCVAGEEVHALPRRSVLAPGERGAAWKDAQQFRQEAPTGAVPIGRVSKSAATMPDEGAACEAFGTLLLSL